MMSAQVKYLLDKVKTSFNPARDLLVISDSHLDEAMKFDEDGWLLQIADNVITFTDDLKNVAVVTA